MKILLNYFVILGILLVNSLFAVNKTGDISVPMAKNARHTIMPFIGYQILDGEQMGFSFSYEVFDPVGLVLVSVNDEDHYESNSKSPEMGLIYRYQTPINMFSIEAGLSLIHDAKNYTRSYLVNFGAYSQAGQVFISHRNTMISSLSFKIDVPTGVKFLSSSIIIGTGYGKRNISGNLDFDYYNRVLNITDSEELLMSRFGLETSIWNKDNFLLKGSIYYSQMMPLDERNDPFGGIGWSFGFFPIWSERR